MEWVNESVSQSVSIRPQKGGVWVCVCLWACVRVCVRVCVCACVSRVTGSGMAYEINQNQNTSRYFEDEKEK